MEIFCGLIQGRHSVPDSVKLFVFSSDIPQMHICDSKYMEHICNNFIDLHSPSTVNVYVTGFTPALLALIKVCNKKNIHVVAYNYDREKRNFWRQEVI